MSFLKRLFQSTNILIEINDDIFKVALAEKNKNDTIKIKNIKRLRIKEEQPRKKQITQFLTKYIKKNDLKMKNNNIYTTLSNEQDLFSNIIEISGNIKEKNLRKAISSNFDKYFPYQNNKNINDVQFDYHILEKDPNYKILLATIQKKHILSYMNDIIFSAKYNFYNIHVKSLVLTSLIDKKPNTKAVLNVSKNKSFFTVVSNGEYKFSKTIDIGKNDFLQCLSQHKSQDMKDIEIENNYFREMGKGEDVAITDLMSNNDEINEDFIEIGNDILRELDISIAYFNNEYQTTIDKLYITENQIKIPGLSNYLKNHLEVEVGEIKNKDVGIESKEDINENAILFSTALSYM